MDSEEEFNRKVKKAKRRYRALKACKAANEAVRSGVEANVRAEKMRVECATMDRERAAINKKYEGTLYTFRQIKDETIFDVEDMPPLAAIVELTDKLGAIQRLAMRHLGESAVG